MVNSWELDRIFGCLADPTRRDIVQRLAMKGGTMTVGEIGREYARIMSKPALSKHINKLSGAKLIQREWEGRVCNIRLNVEPLSVAEHAIRDILRFWEMKLDQLAKQKEHEGGWESTLNKLEKLAA